MSCCCYVHVCVENQNSFLCPTGYSWQYHISEKISLINPRLHDLLKSIFYFLTRHSWVPRNFLIKNFVHQIYRPDSPVEIRTHRELCLEAFSVIYVEDNRFVGAISIPRVISTWFQIYVMFFGTIYSHLSHFIHFFIHLCRL